MTENRLGDLLYLETADGLQLVTDQRLKFPIYGNFGAPPTEWITSRGYKQHGVTEVDYLFNERSVFIDLVRVHAGDRQAYWDARYELHQFLRPNRGGPLLLVLETPNGSRRALYVRPNPGLTGPPPGDNSWTLQESVEFRAFDPIWFNPDAVSLTLNGVVGDNLVFPITFPILFGAAGLNFSTGEIAYTGDWPAYPTITLTGPYTAVRIENITANVRIEMVVPIGAGEQRILNLSPGALSVQDDNGVDRFGDLGSASNLVDFALYPATAVPDGKQTILVNFTGGVQGASGVSIVYNTRYYAI